MSRLNVLGALAIVIFISIPVVLTVRVARKSSRKTDCVNSLKQVGVYYALYEAKYKSYPTKGGFRNFVDEQGSSLDRCKCSRPIHLADPPIVPASAGTVSDQAPPDVPLAWMESEDGDYLVMFFQGRVDVYRPDPAVRTKFGLDHEK